MTKNRKLLVVLIILTLVFIFGNSILDREKSAQESGWVKQLVEPVLEIVVGEGNVTDHLVRKLAHFSEYTLLGLEMMAFFGRPTAVTHCLCTAFLDESIQILTGRGPSVIDIWIDLAGGVFGCLIAWLILRSNHKEC